MHELSLALSLIEVACEEAQRHGARQVQAIHLKLGPLAGVHKDALRSAYELAREQSPLEQADLVIEETAILVHCPSCRATRPAVSLQHISCAECGTATAEVVSGRELEVTALEMSS